MTTHLQAHGLWSFQPNLTITKNGRVPRIKTKVNKDGIRLMPYYFVFDHTGQLVTHSMGGSYHGGDGWAMFDIVDGLLRKTPAIYLGSEPFEHVEALAASVQKGKFLGNVTKKIDKASAGEPEPARQAELERLLAALTRYRDRRLTIAVSREGSEPGRVVPDLEDLAKEFKGSSLAGEVEAKLTAMRASATLAAGVELEKRFRKILKRYESVKPKKRTAALTQKTVEKVQALLEGREEILFAQVIRAWLAKLD